VVRATEAIVGTAGGKSDSATATRSDIEAAAFPTREYIGAMALEMARMARDEGDGKLADLLEQVAQAAGVRPV
jgi:hypothetical protein